MSGKAAINAVTAALPDGSVVWSDQMFDGRFTIDARRDSFGQIVGEVEQRRHEHM